MRAIWSGTIGFGLVNIPVKLYSATNKSRIDLDMLDRRDKERIRYMRVNEQTGKEVPWEKIVKAYKWEDDYIILEDADFEEASPEKSKMIDIKEFVKEGDIDPNYFKKPYYIEPQKGGTKAYSLLVQALKKTKMAGLSSFVMRTTENLAILRPQGDMLVLNQLRFAQEIRDMEDLKLPKNQKVSKMEMDMAVKLVKEYVVDFDISKYKNEYMEDLMKIIKAKAKGKRPTIRKIKTKKPDSSDLLTQLKDSLKTKKKKAS